MKKTHSHLTLSTLNHRNHGPGRRLRRTRGLSFALVAVLCATTAPLWADEGDKAYKAREKYEREHRSSSKSHRYEDRERSHRYDRHRDRDRHRGHYDRDRHRYDRKPHSRYDRRHDDRYYRERYRERHYRDRHRYDRHRYDRYRHDRYRHDRHRYDRHRYDHRHRHHSFSIPRRILHDLLHVYSDYYHARHYYADHGHYHTIYRFPVVIDGYSTYRPYAYCEGELYASGYFTDGGFEFNFNYRD